MVCKNCGVKNPDGVAACRVCGNMEWAEAEVAAPVVEPDTKTCPKCGLVLDADAKFCKNCGTKQEEAPVVVVEEVPVVEEEVAPIVAPVAEPDTKTCPKCGKELAITAKFCNGCGAKQEEEPVVVVEEVPTPVVEKEPAPVVEEVAPIVAPVAEPDTKTCPKCGKELAITAKFCNGCGAKQEEEPVAVVEEVPTPVVEEEPVPVVEEIAPVVVEAPVAEPDTKTCPKCGKELAITAKFCNGCGAKQEEEPVAVVEEVPTPVVEEESVPVAEEVIPAPVAEPDTKTCPKCGKELAITAKFCNGCGAKQEEEPVAVVEEVPTPVVEEEPVPVVEEVVPAPVVEEEPTSEVEEEVAPIVAPVAEPGTKTCSKCGKELAITAKFCNGCGAKQEEEPVAVVEEVPAPVVEEEPASVVEEVVPAPVVEEEPTSEVEEEVAPIVAPVAEPDTKTCPKCGKELAITAKFCNGCGAKQEEEPVAVVEEVPTPVVEEEPVPVVEEVIPAPVAEPDTKVCAQCGMVLAINAKFCKNCGAKQEEAPAVVVEEVPAPVVEEEPVPVVEEEVSAPVVEEEPAPVVEEAPEVEPDTKTCPKCGKVLPKRVKFCTGCGAKQEDVAPTTKTCAGCGKILPVEAKFCLDCGMKQ